MGSIFDREQAVLKMKVNNVKSRASEEVESIVDERVM